jgi:murein DD-endopeptidase MepM/ murein hydrolase activator NlpD
MTRMPRSEQGGASLLFPDLAGAKRVCVNLDAETWLFEQRHPEYFRDASVNPLLDPKISLQMVMEFHERSGARWSYGGYCENRVRLWRNSYLSDKGNYLHLGVDLNVPQGTKVATVEELTVMLVDDDRDCDGGWGPRVFVQPQAQGTERVVLIFAHLQAVCVQPGDQLPAGTVLAEVGGPPNNGNWFPHLHIQAVRTDYFQEILLERFDELDGYGHPAEAGRLRRDFPDPLLRFPEFAVG